MDFQVLSARLPAAGAPGTFGQLTFAVLQEVPGEKPQAWEYEPVEKKISMNFLLAIFSGSLRESFLM